jgi:4-hydroxy-4-methyl-2-oxoglutarate aldolase
MAETQASLLAAGTAVIADVFDSLGETPKVLDTSLFPVKGPGTGFIGPAFTISGRSQTWSGSGDPAKLEAIDSIPAGAVAVWAGNDAHGVCCFGDLLALAMQARQCAGVVVDGGIRDAAFLRTCTMPVVARYCTPAQAIGRWRVIAREIPVQLRGGLEEFVTVHPGDIIAADDDGVIVVPKARLDVVIDKVAQWAAVETHSRDDIKGGMSLQTAYRKYGHL